MFAVIYSLKLFYFLSFIYLSASFVNIFDVKLVSNLNHLASKIHKEGPEDIINNQNNFKLLNIPSIKDLNKQSEMVKFNFLRENLYNGDKNKNIFNDTLKFPTDFTFKIIGNNDSFFVQDIMLLVSNLLNVRKEDIKFSTRDTAGGKYVSITLTTSFKNADELYSCYKEIQKDNRVKFCV